MAHASTLAQRHPSAVAQGPEQVEGLAVATIEMNRRRAPTSPRLLCCLLFIFVFVVAGLLSFTRSSQAEEANTPTRLTYFKVLKGSVPEYMAITVDSNGRGTYDGRKLAEPPNARPLKLSSATTNRLFELAASLNYFQSIDLESHKKVANLGLKTLIYEKDGWKNQAEFNYTLRRNAQELVDLFEKIASVEQHIMSLEYAIKYDHLSLPRELLQIQIDLDNKALAETELMVPALEEIVRNPRFLHLAQVRAQNILHRLQVQGPGARE